jgi:hypothetical protein
MRRRALAFFLVLGVLAVAGCTKSGSTAVKLSDPSWETAKPYPSKSAKMICEPEARDEIARSIGVRDTRVAPSWNQAQHLYSCAYSYPRARIRLTVKELSNEHETTAYFDSIRKKYGTTDRLFGYGGQGAWALKNDDIVVRKEYKVLLVDVSAVPPAEGTIAKGMGRADVATNITTVIMTCWKGA